jgi:hypothetical protein
MGEIERMEQKKRTAEFTMQIYLKTSTGKYFVIVPHADYNLETIEFFKNIGVKGQLFDNGSKLEVKDEDDLSDG